MDNKTDLNRPFSLFKNNRLEHWEIVALYLIIYDIFAVNFSYFIALLMRFDFRYSQIPNHYMNSFLMFAPFYTVFCLIIFFTLRLYKSIWRFASFNELNRILLSSAITTIFHIVGITAFVQRMPISYYIMGAIIQCLLLTVVRFCYRFINLVRLRRERAITAVNRAIIIGAGEVGRMILREINNSQEMDTIACCIIDDNANKWGRFIEGVPVVGGRDFILQMVDKYHINRILFAIPTASIEQKRDILNICNETGCEIQSLPGIYQLVNGDIALSKMKPIAIEDLLGRETIKVNLEGIFHFIKDKTILVTGGGGSIGSELCRQIAGHNPKQLIIFDIYENNAYDIEQELRNQYPNLKLSVLIGSVRDSERLNSVFEHYKPDIVYHAAAHKHVPLMESSPNEAIKNNVIGTYKTASAALKNGAKRFVLISTDKAVNPTSIMGASKRLCEMVIQSMDVISRENRLDLLPSLQSHINELLDNNELSGIENHTLDSNAREKNALMADSVKCKDRKGTQFVAVRFGNVLGSNGSVIPLFKKQIEAGGPVTVTHPDIIRYFMTIPEAVSLVLEAGALAWGGEIFVLDMGDPVKIDTLARNLIKLSGYTPDKDIKIIYTGLRPGEKLYEEKLMAEEGMKKTDNALIHIGKPIPFDVEVFLNQLKFLANASYHNSDNIIEYVENMVPTFHPSGEKPTGNECVKSLEEFQQNI